MCKYCDKMEYYPLPVRRSFSKTLKHVTARKQTSITRINMNKFWNEMEEFNDRRTEEYLDLDTYHCDLEVEEVFVSNKELVNPADWEQDSAYNSFNNSCTPESLCDCSIDTSASPDYAVESPEPSPIPSYQQYDLPSPPASPVCANLPSPPSFSRTKHFLDMVNSMNSFSLCTAV